MPHRCETTPPKVIRKAENIGRQHVEVVGRDVWRLVAQIVAALARRYDVIACRRKRLEIALPGLPIRESRAPG
jgi:hypothetical protein